jgi:CheY-like chemotaxis protein
LKTIKSTNTKKCLKIRVLFAKSLITAKTIETVRNNNYDMVLMDVHLPGINGTIATKQIRI